MIAKSHKRNIPKFSPDRALMDVIFHIQDLDL